MDKGGTMSEPKYRIRLVLEAVGECSCGPLPLRLLTQLLTEHTFYDPRPGIEEAYKAFDDILKTLDDRARWEETHETDY